MFRVRPSSNAGALTCGARKGRERLLPGSCLARRRVPHVNVHAPSAPAGPHSRCNAGGRCARGPLTAGRVDGWACPKAARQGSGHSEHACAWTDSTILQEPANMPSCYPSRHCQPGDRGGPWLTLAYMYVPCIIPMIPHDFHAFPDHCKPVSSRTDTGTGVKQSSAHLPCCWLAPCLLASPSVAIALLSAPGSAAASSACLAAGAFSSAWLSTPRLPDAPAPISAPEPYVGPRAPAPGAQACPGVPASRGSCLPSPRALRVRSVWMVSRSTGCSSFRATVLGLPTGTSSSPSPKSGPGRLLPEKNGVEPAWACLSCRPGDVLSTRSG